MEKINNWKGDSHQTDDKSHGRWDRRLYLVSDLFDDFVDLSFDWKGMKTLEIVVSARMQDGEVFNIDNTSIRYYISSAKLNAEELGRAAREHWHIENKLHWKLDVAMREDDCRIRRGNAASLLTGFRHIAINLLNNTKTFKGGLKRKQKKAALSIKYLSEVLSGCVAS